MKTQINYFLVLDIETSKLKMVIDGKEKPTAVWLSYGYCKLYSNKGETIKTCCFRLWEDLEDFLYSISSRYMGLKILCYVHNLSYESDFLFKNISRPEKMLCNSSHNVISCTLEKYPQIEFRCSFMLSNKSLAELGEMMGFEKLKDDYSMILPKDTIPQNRLLYCERDCDVVAKYIADYCITEYGTLPNIPYTKTGRVRKKFGEFYKMANEKILDWDLMPPEDCYELLNNSFRGAITISNPRFTGVLLKNVTSYDEKSEYPSIMLKEKFPRTIKRCKDKPKTEYWIAKVKFYNIDSKYEWLWLSKYKMQDYEPINSIWFNGKLHYADYIITTITNIDYDLINLTYSYSDIEFLECAELFDVDLLPESYFNTLFEFSKAKDNLKQKLKGKNENDEDYFDLNIEYMKAKNDFNSIYGMTVQKLMSPEYELDKDFIWHEKDIPYKQQNKHLKRNFLFGIFVTAYARRNLIRAIIKNCPKDFIYADTDSIKFILKSGFIDTNEPLPEKLNNIKSLHNLGLFEFDAHYDKFITYGAKKYAYEIDGVAHCTVAGLPKKIKVDGELKTPIKTLDDFKLGKTFYNCKLGKMYITNGYNLTIDDDRNVERYYLQDSETTKFLKDNNIKTKGGVALFETDYTLDMSKEDKHYLKTFYRREL